MPHHEERRLEFHVIPRDDGSLQARACVPDKPDSSPPSILEKLVPCLERGRDMAPLTEEFPSDAGALREIELLLASHEVEPRSIHGIHWNTEGGHVLFFRMTPLKE